MRKFILLFVFISIIQITTDAQVVMPKFGKGLNLTAADTSFQLNLAFRFQTLSTHQWEATESGFSGLDNYESTFMIRRSRIKMKGWALTKNLKYKAELSLSNRDNGGGNSSTFSNAANIILDAFVEYKFLPTLSIRLGQFKLPGNRERVISSGNMQFVDRSRLNSRYTLDRDVGIMLINAHKIGDNFLLKEMFAYSSGEGKNITATNVGGYGYSFRVEALPFGKFQSKGDYIGSAIKYEEKPKLALAVTYDLNDRAGRERGQKGSFIPSDAGLKDISSVFVDLMFKYQNWSLMAEYADRATEDDNPYVFTEEDEIVGTYYVGSGINVALGYMLKNNWEIAARWTDISPDEGVANPETQYTFGVSKYVVGHKLKIQTDLTFRDIEESNNDLFYRLQVDFHF